MKLLDVFRFCKQCAKSALFTEIGEDGLCPKCRDAAARKKEDEVVALEREAIESEDRRKRAAQALRFCSGCAKNGLFVDIGEDNLCPKCREEMIRKAEEEAAEYARRKAEAEDRKRRAAQQCHKCRRNGLNVEITQGSVCNSCREKYPRIRDELRARNDSYRKWFLCSMEHIRTCREKFIAFDLETTGLSTWTDRIVELGAVIFEDFQPVAEFSTLVNPERHINSEASRVNGIYDKDVENAPYIHEAIENFCDFIGPDALSSKIILVAHNADFDAKFLLEAFNDCGVTAEIVVQDTLYMAQTMIPELYRHRLSDVAKYFDISQKKAHRAADDARVCGEIFARMLQLRETRLEEKKSALLPMELEIAQWLKAEVEAAGLDTSFFTLKLGKTFCAIKCGEEVLRVKLHGKKPYALIPAAWPVPEGMTTEPTTKSEGEMNVRLLFTSLEDLHPFRARLVARYQAAMERNMERINASVRDFQLASEAAGHEITL